MDSVERVVERTVRYAVVRKLEDTAHIITATDPRS
jgi:hypothetical protein